MHLECWIGNEGCDITLTTPENIKYLQSQKLMADDATFQYAIHADTWTEVMTIHHILRGWKPYIPFGDDEDE